MNNPSDTSVSKSTTTISAKEFKQQKQSPGNQLRVIDVRTHAEVNSESLADCAHFPLQDLNSAAVQAYLEQQSHDSSQHSERERERNLSSLSQKGQKAR